MNVQCGDYIKHSTWRDIALRVANVYSLHEGHIIEGQLINQGFNKSEVIFGLKPQRFNIARHQEQEWLRFSGVDPCLRYVAWQSMVA